MSLPWRRLLALLLVASSCRGAPESHEGGSLPLAAQQPWLPPLPPCRDALGSLACTLAGGWCPAHEAGLQHSRCSDGSGGCSNGTSNGSSNGTQPGPQQHKPLRPLDRTDWLGLGTAAVALLLAATGDIGGGAILVPIYLMVLGERMFFGCCFPNADMPAQLPAAGPSPRLPALSTSHSIPTCLHPCGRRLLHCRRRGAQQHHHRWRHACQLGIQHRPGEARLTALSAR